ncbi:LamG-like jellyroll fold domain-containing protein [Lutimaribacter marinistellae]|uniref:LamG-like jellyroll fold domain-containing protein n=1 Tax=Lutimaribacter marinistellae TaxID=1820329 RepID=A0ABV7TAT6_9RHOB
MGQHLDQYVRNVEAIDRDFDRYDDGLKAAAKTLKALGNVQEALSKASKDAEVIDRLVDDFRDVTTFLKLFPPTSSIARSVDRILDKVAARSEQIKEALARHETEIKVFGVAITTAKTGVKALQLDLANDQGDIASIRSSLLDLQEAVNLDPAALSDEAQLVLEQMENLFEDLNSRFPEQALEEMETRVTTLESALAPFSDMGNVMEDFRNGLDAVASKLEGIGKPLSVITDALSPLTWVLEKAESAIGTVTRPVLDPVMEALGVQALVDAVDNAIGGLLPNISFLNPLDGIPDDFPTIFGTDPDFDQPMISAIEDVRGAVDDVPSLNLKNNLAARLLGENGYVEPLLRDSGAPGTDVLLGINALPFLNSDLDAITGLDVLSAGIGNDTLDGGPQDDIIVNAGGDDVFDGGEGFDTLYTNAPLFEFTFEVIEEGSGASATEVMLLNHVGGGLLGNFGSDRVMRVEHLVFGSAVYTFEALATALRVDYGVSNERDGGPEDDLILGAELADVLRGQGGNDALIGGAGLDTLDGGAGRDRVDYSGENTTGIRAVLGPTGEAGLGSLTDDLRGIEDLLGSVGDDLLVGSAVANSLNGNRGDDTIAGREGNDSIVLGTGFDIAAGGAGDDVIETRHGGDLLLAGAGNDNYYINRSDNAGDIVLYGLGASPLLDGQAGSDVLAPLLIAEPGNQLPSSINVAENGDRSYRIEKFDADGRPIGADVANSPGLNAIGTNGADAFRLSWQFGLFDGSAGNDLFEGNARNIRDAIPEDDELPPLLRAFGGDGDDRLTSRTMDDSFVGGAGDDTYAFVEFEDDPTSLTDHIEDRQRALFFGGSAPEGFGDIVEGTDPETGTPTYMPRDPGTIDPDALADDGTDTLDLSGSERYWLIDTENGRAESKSFIGRGGLVAFDPSDNLISFFGVERFLGGQANDWLILGNDPIEFRGNDGLDRIIPGLAGGNGGVRAYGGEGNDVFHSGFGFDRLEGGPGNDMLRNNGNYFTPNSARESLFGGDGRDYLRVGNSDGLTGSPSDFFGGADRDIVELFLAEDDTVRVNLAEETYETQGVTAAMRDVEAVIVNEATATLIGSEGADALQAGDGGDLIDAGAGNDILIGWDGNDTLRGGDGNDLLDPGSGDATVYGGVGEDELRFFSGLYWSQRDGLVLGDFVARRLDWTIDVGAQTATSSGGTVAFTGIERFAGGWAQDSIIGTGNGDYLSGHNGDDHVQGFDGDDTLHGGRDDDLVEGGDGDDILSASTGTDKVIGGTGSDLLQFDRDISELQVWVGRGYATGTTYDSVEGAPDVFFDVSYRSRDYFREVEVFRLSDNADRAEGSDNRDEIIGAAGNDTLVGLAGNDHLEGGDGDDLIHGDGQSTTPVMAHLDQSSERSFLELSGFAEMPTDALTIEMLIRANRGENSVLGMPVLSYAVPWENNEFALFTGADGMLRIIVNGELIGTDISDLDLFDGKLKRLSVTWQADGGRLGVYIDGELEWSGSDLAGADTPITGGGALAFGHMPDGAAAASGLGQFADLTGAFGDIRIFDEPRSEDEIWSYHANPLDTETRDAPAFVAEWQFDPDAPDGQSATLDPLDQVGAVRLEAPSSGDAGDDVIRPGGGFDTVDGGGGQDTVDFTDHPLVDGWSAGDLLLDLELASGLGRIFGGESNTLISVEHAVGTAWDDRLVGDSGANRLIGLAGDDVIDGGTGSDTLNGGDGDDRILGGPTQDDLRDVIVAGGGDDDADGGGGNDLLYGQEGNDTLAGGFGADEVQGQEGDDVLTGGALSDLVFGGSGNDFVNGGFGYDRINGGTGADRFFHLGVFDHGSDWVQDYDAGEGDMLVFGQSAGRNQFQVNLAHTATADGERSGNDALQEAFVIHRPTGQIIWALVDGEGQSTLTIQSGGETFELMV